MGLIYKGVKGIVTAIKNRKAQKRAASQPRQEQSVQQQQSPPPQQQMPSFGGGDRQPSFGGGSYGRVYGGYLGPSPRGMSYGGDYGGYQQAPFRGGIGYSGIRRPSFGVEGGAIGFTQSTRHMRPDLMLKRFGSQF